MLGLRSEVCGFTAFLSLGFGSDTNKVFADITIKLEKFLWVFSHIFYILWGKQSPDRCSHND